MRQVDTCQYRTTSLQIAGDSKHRCRFLVEISGVDSDLADVSNDVCTYCCTQFEPSGTNPNPTVASMLYHLAAKVIERGGVAGCGTSKAEKLQQSAIGHLQVVNGKGDATIPPPYAGSCFYLGDQVGEQACRGCRGNTKIKTFGCQHEGHETTTIRDCQSCLDYELPLSVGRVKDWCVGVTTAPRRATNLEESLGSLAQAGWSQPHVFAEPESVIPSDLHAGQLTMRSHSLGAWPNFYTALTELVMRAPDADAYMMCQDDVVYCQGLRDYLEKHLWPADRLGVVSLHTASHQDRGDADKFYAADLGWSAWGAQAYVFPNAAARALLRNARVLNHRQRGPRDGLCNVDSVVGQWCRDAGLDYYLHTPSLTQHIGETSTLWPTAKAKGRRRAATFVEEVS